MSDQKKISRRRFLGISAGVVGAGVFLCGGGATVALIQPPVDLSENSYGTGETMNKKILVAYASRAGSTSGVADEIGKKLAEGGATVDVRNVKDVTDVSQYSAVVVGSAIYMGQWMKEAMQFVESNQDALKRIPTATFLVCLTLAEDTEANRKTVAEYLAPVRALAPSVDEGLFAGALVPSRLPLLFRWISKAMKSPEGDFRKMDLVRAWAGSLAPKLGVA